MIQILYIGRHPEILATVVRLINANENWSGSGAGTDEEAIQLFSENTFDIVLLGCGLETESDEYLRKTFTELRPEIKIVQHYGGGSGLLTSEILIALAS